MNKLKIDLRNGRVKDIYLILLNGYIYISSTKSDKSKYWFSSFEFVKRLIELPSRFRRLVNSYNSLLLPPDVKLWYNAILIVFYIFFKNIVFVYKIKILAILIYIINNF